MKKLVVIGSGHAALTLVRELRALNAQARITLLTRESGDMYYKPNLSKALSMNKLPRDLLMKRKTELEQLHDISILARVEVDRIARAEKRVAYLDENGQAGQLQYDELVLATGAAPLDLNLGPHARLISVNSLDDYEVMRSLLDERGGGIRRIAIIGAGYVGIELASDLCSNGYEVSLIDAGGWPLNRVLPEVLGQQIIQAFPPKKVAWYLNRQVYRVDELNGLMSLMLDDGSTDSADLVISAVGLKPNTGLAEDCGLAVARGIVTDACLRTSDPSIYALGDCAETHGTLRPFVGAATQAAKALAKTLCGELTDVDIKAQPVAVKLAFLPLVICPSTEPEGEWQIEGEGANIESRFVSKLGLEGFALSGTQIGRKAALAQDLI